MKTKKDDGLNSVISELTDDCKGCTTAHQVKNRVFSILWELYHGKPGVSKQRVALVAEDLAESVCLNLNIAQA